MTLTIWGRLNSHNVKKVAWFVVEAGIDHVRRDIGGKFGFTEAYLAKNPNAMIPAIEEEDGFVLWESNTILRYLAARHAPHFWPDEPRARARADRWMDWQIDYGVAQLGAFYNLVRRPPEERDMAAVKASAEKAGALMGILDGFLAKQPWLTGDDFGIGDIPMGVYAHSWFTLDIDRPDRPHVAAWYEKLKVRPGYADTVMIPLT